MKRALTFADGLGTALALMGLSMLLWFTSKAAQFEVMYRELGAAAMPSLTRLVFHPAWQLGTPAIVLGLGALVLLRRIRFAMVGVAILALVLAGITYQGLYGPLLSLAGNVAG